LQSLLLKVRNQPLNNNIIASYLLSFLSNVLYITQKSLIINKHLLLLLLRLESIYLEEKPTLWSVKGRTGLDDDEASMDMIPMQGTFVKFEVTSFGKNLLLEQLSKEKGMKVFVVGFTTELWTLNNLKALSVNENIQYGIYAFDNALHVISRQRYKNHRLFFREHDAALLATQTGN